MLATPMNENALPFGLAFTFLSGECPLAVYQRVSSLPLPAGQLCESATVSRWEQGAEELQQPDSLSGKARPQGQGPPECMALGQVTLASCHWVCCLCLEPLH